MKKGWSIWSIFFMLFWFGLGIFGTYHFVVKNEIEASFVLAAVSIGIGVNTAINEARSKAIENKIDGLGYKIDGLNQSLNQRLTDHLSKHK